MKKTFSLQTAEWDVMWVHYFVTCLCIQSVWTSVILRNDFGGEFSGSSVSGTDAPGPTANTMGDKAASAMAIGTGSAGAGDYTSNYKTPNYTQYTSQDFKEYMPNYQDMMESSMDKMSGMGGGTSSMGFGNFSAVGSMLKAFMDLQKEQLAVEKAKTEANKAKVDLAMNYEDEEVENEEENEKESREAEHVRRKRSLLTLLSPSNSVIPFGVSKPVSRPAFRPTMPKKLSFAPIQPMQALNRSDAMAPKVVDPSLTQEEKVTLKKIMGLLQVPQVKTLLDTMTSLSGSVDKAPKRRSRQSGSQASSPPPPADGPPSGPPPPSQSSSQSSQQSDSDWKKYLSSPTSDSPTATGSGGDWSKYMGSSTSSGSWGGSQKKRRRAQDSSKGSGWSNPGWSSSSPSEAGGSSKSKSPSPGSVDWANGGGSSGGSWGGATQRRRIERSLMGGDPSMSPVHGSMNLMNLPIYSSPTPNNIPNLSFSLNPTAPDHEEVEEEEEEPEMKYAGPKRPPIVLALPQQSPLSFLSPAQASPPMMMMSPLSYESPPMQLQAPSVMYPQVPLSEAFVLREPVVDPSSLEPAYRASSVLYNGPKPMFYNAPSPKFYNSPSGLLSPSGELIGAMPLEQPPLAPTYDQPKPLQLYRIGRSPDMEDDPPISIYKVTKGADGPDEIKKLIFDIDQGIILSQTDRSKEELPEITNKKHIMAKRSIFDSDDELEDEDSPGGGGLEDIPFVHVPFFKGTEKLLTMNHHFEDGADDRQRRPPPVTTAESSPVNETVKESRTSGYQYQADGSDTDYDYAETPQIDEGPEEQDESRRVRREVNIGFDQKGELPPGSTETISGGGGRSPGHHEGGGLTVKIKIPPKGRYIIDTTP